MRTSAGVTMLVALTLLISGCTKLGLFRRAESPRVSAGPREGAVAPDLEGEDFDGKRFKLSDYRGKVVVVTFWASACRPCRALIPHERALAARFRDSPVVLVGINYDNNPEHARKAIATDGVTWRNMQTCCDDHPVKKLWPVEGLPTTCLIDAQGVIREIHLGSTVTESAIKTLLAEGEKRKDPRTK
jgi:thiol-disulfide isomerase/thioredoxin